MLINADLPPGPRRYALRHGLGHVLAGHTCLGGQRDRDWTARDEAVADLFALIDVVPSWRLGELIAAGYEQSEVERWVYAEVARWTSGWSSERLASRVWLRLQAR